MTIEKNKVVSLNYTLKDDTGTVIDKAENGSFVYVHGSETIIQGLEEALENKKSGDQFSTSIKPELGYGERNEELAQTVPIDMFENKDDVIAGREFHAEGEQGEPIVITIIAVEGDQVTIDGNHPLAGKDLHFDVTVVDVRDATDEEIEHGHVHSEACNHDH